MVFQYLGISLSGRSLRLVSQIYRIGEIASLADVSCGHKAYAPDSPWKCFIHS
jgi:hypothetical protein